MRAKTILAGSLRHGMRCWIVGWCLTLFLLPVASALDASFPLSELEHTVFRPRDGAPANIMDIRQTPDGFLWLATSSGLFQFDGVRFRRYQAPDGQALPDSDIFALTTTPGGALWVGTRFGHVYLVEGGRLRQFGVADGLPAHTVCGIAVDGRGDTWVGSARSGVFRFKDNHWIGVPQTDGSPVLTDFQHCIAADRTGNVWAASFNNVFHLSSDTGRFELLPQVRRNSLGFLLDQDGKAWHGSDAGFFSMTEPAVGMTHVELESLGEDSPRTQTSIEFFDRSGMVWGLANGRVFRMPASWLKNWDPRHPPGRPQFLSAADRVNADRPLYSSTLEDREGNVWMATMAGLERFRSTKFRRATGSGRSLAEASVAVGPSGILWVAGPAGLFFRHPKGEFIADANTRDSPRFALVSTLATRDGSFYIGGQDLMRWTPSGVVTIPFDAGNAPPNIHAMVERVDGELWMSMVGRRGLFVQKDEHWTRRDGISGIPPGPPLSMATENGRMWLGYPNNVMTIVDADRARSVGTPEGLQIGNLLVMLPAGGCAWLGGSNGLAYFDGRSVHSIANSSHIALTGLTGIVMTPDGDLWLNDDAGIQRIPRSEVAAVIRDPQHPVDGEFFDVHSGAEGSAGRLQPLPTLVRTSDGLLWFSTSNGLFWIDPGNIARTITPQAYVLGVHANGADVTGDVVKLPARTDAIQVDYTSPILAVPDLARFKYRLTGVDTEWQNAGSRRQAFYTNLAPGDYRFEVMVENEDGMWSPVSAGVAISIAPAYWQTTWFRGGVAAVATLLLFSAGIFWHRGRLHRLERVLRREVRIQNDERERIARDLHDTLLQNMYGFLWRIETIVNGFGPDDPKRAELTEALDRVDAAIKDGRERVLSLRAPLADCRELVVHLAELGQQWAEDTGTTFEVEADEAQALAHPVLTAVRDAMARILAEAIANAFRHANATTVRLRLRHGDDALVGEVVDDGIGIAPALAGAKLEGHIGIQVMRDRARSLGAKLEFESQRARGTRVRVSIKASRAYEKGLVRRRPFMRG